MPEVYKVSCECGKHDFVFPQKPWRDTEVKCPECGRLWTVKGDPPKEAPPAVAKPLEPKPVKEAPAPAAAAPKKEGDK